MGARRAQITPWSTRIGRCTRAMASAYGVDGSVYEADGGVYAVDGEAHDVDAGS